MVFILRDIELICMIFHTNTQHARIAAATGDCSIHHRHSQALISALSPLFYYETVSAQEH